MSLSFRCVQRAGIHVELNIVYPNQRPSTRCLDKPFRSDNRYIQWCIQALNLFTFFTRFATPVYMAAGSFGYSGFLKPEIRISEVQQEWILVVFQNAQCACCAKDCTIEIWKCLLAQLLPHFLLCISLKHFWRPSSTVFVFSERQMAIAVTKEQLAVDTLSHLNNHTGKSWELVRREEVSNRTVHGSSLCVLPEWYRSITESWRTKFYEKW